ncbi:MAG TPA: hypothetical protein VJ302_35395, partial [Blastocatellia bacterium]|nr:hypothetical protein [Blastocatellia bacterium]
PAFASSACFAVCESNFLSGLWIDSRLWTLNFGLDIETTPLMEEQAVVSTGISIAKMALGRENRYEKDPLRR